MREGVTQVQSTNASTLRVLWQ